MITKSIIGAKGLNSTASKFLMDQKEAQTLENFLVTTGSRKRRQQYARWKYDKFCSNAVRMIGTYKKSFIVIKDAINTNFNSFGTAVSSTLEIRFRLHGVGGYSFKDPIHLCSRQIHGTGNTFDLRLIASTSPVFDVYYPRLIISDGSGTYTVNFNVSTQIKYGIWYTLTILKDHANSKFRCLLNGVFTEDITYASLGGTPGGAQGVYGTTRSDNTYSDIVIGADNALADFSSIDVDEIRLWNEARSDGNVLAYYDREVPAAARTNMICYATFQENHDGNISNELISSTNKIFFGGQMPFKDANDYLVFDGCTMFGKTNPIGGVLTVPYNLWGSGNGGQIYKTSEVAVKILKLKQCSIIGNLEMYYDGGAGKYGFRFQFTNNNLPVTIDSGGIINNSDLDVTDYHIAIRSFESASPRVELWVNGVLKATTVYVGVHGGIAAEPGRYVGCNPAGTSEFSCIRLKWFRVFDSEIPDDSYFTGKYNQEPDDFILNWYSHGVMTESWSTATNRSIVGTGTNMNALVGGVYDQYYISLKENKEQVGEDYQDWINTFTPGTQTILTIYGDSTGDPWANAAYPQITNKEGFFVTTLLTRYNSESWRNIKLDKTTGITEAYITSKIIGGYDRDRDPGYKLELYYYAAAANQSKKQLPSFIGGTIRPDNLKPCRYLGQFKTLDGFNDYIICIVGTSFCTFNRLTKALTFFNVSILPNEDKPFIGDLLNGELFLTDGVTKLHVYSYKKNLRVVKWGFDRGELLTPTGYVGGAGPWSARLQYSYAYYNRELDQFGPLCFPKSDGSGPQETLVTHRAVTLSGITPCPDFYEGVTDIAIFRTKDLLGAGAFIGHYWLYDFVMGNSQGAMDWSQVDTRLSQRYPTEIAVATDTMKPPNGAFVVSHNKRLWIPNEDFIQYSRIGSELHTGLTKSETHLFPGASQIRVSGSRKITGGASFSDKVLFLFTVGSMDMVIGNDEFDFEIRKVHEGIGCVAHRTIVKYGETLVWLGLEDIYYFEGGLPRPFDRNGKISEYIKTQIDPTSLENAFAVINRNKLLYELHVTRTDGIKVVIVLDLKNGEFSIFKDVHASYGCEVYDSYNKPSIFYGTEKGFIVNEDSSGRNYQPPSGSVKTTVSSYNLGTLTLTTAASDLYISEAGLIGNIVYVVSNQAATKGSVIKAMIVSNTANTIVHDLDNYEVCFGVEFTPVSGDDVYIGPIFTKWKSPIYFSTSVQDSVLQAPEGGASDLNGAELIQACFIHNRGNAAGNAYVSLYRDGETTPSKTLQIPTLDKDFSWVHFTDSSRARFFEFETYHLHESAEYEHTGYTMAFDVGSDALGTS